jgi:plasmid stability protein
VPTITVKNIPERTYNVLKKQAAEHRRSINSEIIYIIERATRSNKIDPFYHLQAARRIRKKTEGHTFLNTDMSNAKNRGRP